MLLLQCAMSGAGFLVDCQRGPGLAAKTSMVPVHWNQKYQTQKWTLLHFRIELEANLQLPCSCRLPCSTHPIKTNRKPTNGTIELTHPSSLPAQASVCQHLQLALVFFQATSVVSIGSGQYHPHSGTPISAMADCSEQRRIPCACTEHH